MSRHVIALRTYLLNAQASFSLVNCSHFCLDFRKVRVNGLYFLYLRGLMLFMCSAAQ